MTRIKSITVHERDVKAPVHIQLVTENGEQHWVKFRATRRFVDLRIKFMRTEEYTSEQERHVA